MSFSYRPDDAPRDCTHRIFRVAIMAEGSRPEPSSYSEPLTLEEAQAKVDELNRYLPPDMVASVLYDDPDLFEHVGKGGAVR